MFSQLRILVLLLLTLTGFAVARHQGSAADSSKYKAAHKPAKLHKAAAVNVSLSGKKASARGEEKARSRRSSRHASKKLTKAEAKKVRRMQRAFVASSELKPMARQLVGNRTATAYAAVEAYARRHAGTDAGALAWIAVGYAHYLDREYEPAVTAMERARDNAGDLLDYVQYFEGVSYAGMGESARAVELLRDFDEKMPESIFQKDVVTVYGSALSAAGRTQEAIDYLEQHRQPQRASVELALGKSYIESPHPEKGMEILKHLYFTMPLSPEAAEAAAKLSAAGSALEGSYADEKSRADLLAGAGRWPEAERAYRELEGREPASEQGGIQVALASAMRHSNAEGARVLLQGLQATGEANAQRLYLLVEIARGNDNESALTAHLDRLRQEAPASPWFAQALLSAANYYLLEKNFDRAAVFFGEVGQRFPGHARASYAAWKAAWLTFRLGRTEDAKHAFESQVALYPDRPEIPAALYWRARIAEEEHDIATARTWYALLGERFPNYYYGYLGRERLAALTSATPVAATLVASTGPVSTSDGAPNAPPAGAALTRIPRVQPPGPEALEVDAPPNQLRAEKSQLLANAGLYEFAIRELQAEQGGHGVCWATLEIARIYQESGQSHRAIQFMKRAVPSYFAMDIDTLPRPYWEILFPLPYWSELRRNAQANSLDPYLVASLIRQESEFNPDALSRANAYGLMQLLPQVGRGQARAARIPHFSVSSLYEPSVNIELGTRYFREMVTQYNGQVEYALAAYNAGSNRVDEWLQSGHYRDVAEFVESIPFTETREYVQAIMRNARVYRRLYPQP